MIYDFIVIGGGIIGISTAWQLKQRLPDSKILLLEKEAALATHQTGRNSGVIHAGVYYKPGSLKARFCREGLAATLEFCQQFGIPYQQCGKLLVATSDLEQQRMAELVKRCQQNRIETEQLDKQQLRELEPHISGQGALLVKTTGIVNYRQIANEMAQQFRNAGGEIKLNERLVQLAEKAEHITALTASNHRYQARFLISCAGLMSDRVARQLGIKLNFRIIPFRGEYYQLPAALNHLFQHLIYPIPDPSLPFLGIHLTRMINGRITLGPNAVLGWKREGYRRLNFSPLDTLETLSFPGFWRNLKEYFRPGLLELRNAMFKRRYLQQAQKYCPQLRIEHLQSYPAGVRAQAVMRDGTLAHDFLFAESARSLHVCNAPSPAATSAIPIGRYICNKICTKAL